MLAELLGLDGSSPGVSLSFCRIRFSETGKAVPRDWAKSDNAYSSIVHAMSLYWEDPTLEAASWFRNLSISPWRTASLSGSRIRDCRRTSNECR